MPATQTKQKITITLRPDTLDQLDTLIKLSRIESRSTMVEEAIQLWLRERAKKEIERQTEEYYRSLTNKEKKEDREWSEIAVKSTKHFWEE